MPWLFKRCNELGRTKNETKSDGKALDLDNVENLSSSYHSQKHSMEGIGEEGSNL